MGRDRIGVLIMAYGSAPTQDDEAILAYLRHILQHYRQTDPSEQEFNHLKQRYLAIGESPLYSTCERIAEKLQHALDLSFPNHFRVYLAMKHSPPFIEDMVAEMAGDGIRQAVGLALAPFPSRMSTEGYYHLIREANEGLKRPIQWAFAESWNLHPLFLRLWHNRIDDALSCQNDVPVVVFTNHSLPAIIQQWDDPYTREFEKTAAELARKRRLQHWQTAYQSQGGGKQSWLGPELVTILEQWEKKGHQHFLVAPIGFLMDHLETLYDLDVETQAEATKLELTLRRTRMPNDDPLLIGLLREIILTTFRTPRRR